MGCGRSVALIVLLVIGTGLGRNRLIARAALQQRDQVAAQGRPRQAGTLMIGAAAGPGVAAVSTTHPLVRLAVTL